jgi:hypothetical protein
MNLVRELKVVIFLEVYILVHTLLHIERRLRSDL